MSSRNLAQWLDWQSGLSPQAIDLGLDRVRTVWHALGAPGIAHQVVTVAGTNGKGSCVAMLDSVLRSAGYRVGCYTSPHLLRYNERIRIAGEEADDAAICAAFERIEAARGETRLTYFEFGTLAALLLFADAALDAAILEVGLGGRLDAVNIIDADVAMISGIGLDHTDWLGNSLEAIGAEKAGILRSGRPAVFAAPQMPASVAATAQRLGARLLRLAVDYRYQAGADGWRWIGAERRRDALPLPGMRGRVQLQNAAAVVQVLELLSASLPVDQQSLKAGLLGARIAGRFEIRQRGCRWVLDVAHNPQAASLLAEQLGDLHVAGTLHAVVGMLRDKALVEVLGALAPRVDRWHLLDLGFEARGAAAGQLLDALPERARANAECCAHIPACLTAVDRKVGADDLVLVFGSFHTLGAVMAWMQSNP